MSDKRKPVICPWCGAEMELDYINMITNSGRETECVHFYACPECHSQTPRADSEESAYEAATRTPSNRPMTKEQILAMDPYDAVWMASANPAPLPVRSVRSAEWVQHQLTDRSGADWMERKLLFSAKPATSDIEAARKARIDGLAQT